MVSADQASHWPYVMMWPSCNNVSHAYPRSQTLWAKIQRSKDKSGVYFLCQVHNFVIPWWILKFISVFSLGPRIRSLWFLASLAEGQRGLCLGSSSVVRASVNSFLVTTIETTFLNQSGPNLHEVFMGTRSQMSLIVSKICPVTPGLLPLKYWKLLFLTLLAQ